jgi:hypothetical protein
MKVTSIFLFASSSFSSKIQTWAEGMATELHSVQDKNADFFEQTDSLLIFNQNQELDSEIEELKARYDKQQKPVHKIDLNGTLQVGVTNLALWLDATKAKKMLVVGADELVNNPNLERYLGAI